MADSLRDRIAAVLQAQPPVRLQSQSDWLDWTENRADAVIRELGTKRRCERCRMVWPLARFPLPHEGDEVMRPYCEFCTEYIEWATS